MSHICLFGHGYIGQAFAKEMFDRGVQFHWMRHDEPMDLSRIQTFDLIINCAAFIPKPSISKCDEFPKETIDGNLLLPIELASTGVPLMQISTGCVYDDKKVYTEDDPPTRGFHGYCGMYVGTKLMMEEAVRKFEKHYLLRMRLPFDEFDCDRNYISKIARYPLVYDHTNSLTHRGDFVKAALDLYDAESPYGTYHMVNEGAYPAGALVELLLAKGIAIKRPSLIPGPAAGCTLSIDKLKSTGVKMRSVRDAIDESIRNWKKA